MKRRNFFWYGLLFVAGCTTANSNPNGSSSNWGETGPKKLRLAVTDKNGLEELQRDYESFRKALEEVLERNIEFFPVSNYIAAVVALQSDMVDLVLTGPSEYVVINSRTNASPVIAIARQNYHSIIAVPSDSAIESVAQLKGKTIALWDVGSTSGHLGPTKFLIDAGLDPKSDLKVVMLKGKGLPALKNGSVDAWGGSAVRYKSFLRSEGLSESAFRLIVTGPTLPNDLFITNSKLAPEFVEEMRSRIVKNQDKLIQSLLPVEDGKFKDAKLVPAQDADYNMIREVYKAMGQDDFIK